MILESRRIIAIPSPLFPTVLRENQLSFYITFFLFLVSLFSLHLVFQRQLMQLIKKEKEIGEESGGNENTLSAMVRADSGVWNDIEASYITSSMLTTARISSAETETRSSG